MNLGFEVRGCASAACAPPLSAMYKRRERESSGCGKGRHRPQRAGKVAQAPRDPASSHRTSSTTCCELPRLRLRETREAPLRLHLRGAVRILRDLGRVHPRGRVHPEHRQALQLERRALSQHRYEGVHGLLFATLRSGAATVSVVQARQVRPKKPPEEAERAPKRTGRSSLSLPWRRRRLVHQRLARGCPLWRPLRLQRDMVRRGWV